MKINKKKKAMSLVEVMAALAITSILFIGISDFIITNSKSQAKTSVRLNNIKYVSAISELFETKEETTINNSNNAVEVDGGNRNDSDTVNYILDYNFKSYFVGKKIWLNFQELNDIDVLVKALKNYTGAVDYAYPYNSGKNNINIGLDNIFTEQQPYVCSINTTKVFENSNLYKIEISIENKKAGTEQNISRTIYISHI